MLELILCKFPALTAGLPSRRQHRNLHGTQFPDDDSNKVVICEADGLDSNVLNPDDRHVLLRWTNGTDAKGTYVQIIQLSGGPGNYAFHTPSVRRSMQAKNTEYLLRESQYTRAERDQIVALAKKVEFEKTSQVNNCQTWLRDLLEAMVEARLLNRDIFEKIDVEVPLKKRVAELRDDSESETV